MKLVIMQSPPVPCYLVPLRPKYLPQHPILEQPHATGYELGNTPHYSPQNKTTYVKQ